MQGFIVWPKCLGTETTKTKKSRERNGSDRNGQTELARSERPDRKVLFLLWINATKPSTAVTCMRFSAKHTKASVQPVTDSRIGQIGHVLGPRVYRAPSSFFLWRLITNLKFITDLKFAKLHGGITSQFTLKRAKMQRSRLWSVQ